MLASRRIRVAVGIFMLAAVWNLFWTRATSYVSTQAVVDAPLLTIRAPTDGTLVAASPALGAPVTPDTRLLKLSPSDSSPQDLLRLSGDILTARAEEAALSREAAAAMAMISTLTDRAAAEREQEIRYLTQKLAEMVEIRQQHVVRWDLASEQLARAEQLADNGRVSDVNVRTAALDLQLADAMIAEADARAAAVRTELTAIEMGLPSPAGTGRRASSFDRLDDMRVHLNDLRTRQAIVSGRRAGLELRLAGASDLSERVTQFVPMAATHGVIWRASPPRGSSATRGTSLAEILDCQRRFVEVVLTERIFETLTPGTTAQVKLKGADTTFSAPVAFRRADGSGSALSGGARSPNASPVDGGVRVYLSLPPADVSGGNAASRFCDVGRTAEVTFARPSLRDRFPALASWINRMTVQTKRLSGGIFPSLAG